jgi:hypothetical protein
MKFLPINEGVDHVNIYSKSSLDLGKQLSNFAYTPFTCEDGNFNSIEGYWYWLHCGHNELKILYGFNAKKFGQLYVKTERKDDEFVRKIKIAIENKINQNSNVKLNLQKSVLPLTHYYYYGDIKNPKIVELPQYQWIVDCISEIRQKNKL